MGQAEIWGWLASQRLKTPKFWRFKEIAEALPGCQQGLRRAIGKLRHSGLLEFRYGPWYDYELRVRARKDKIRGGDA